MINPRGRLHLLSLLVYDGNSPQEFAAQLDGELIIYWDYEDLGGLWRSRCQATFKDSPGRPSSLSWEDNASRWREGNKVVISLGSDLLFEGRILSITAPTDEANYPGDWRISIEAGDALYYANYQNRDMGNYALTSLDGNSTLGDALNSILTYAGLSLSNASSLSSDCNLNLASRDQEGLISGFAGPLAYQRGQYVLAANGTTITAYQEDLTGTEHTTYSINETLEFAPIPSGEPLVEELELLSNTQQYINQGSADYQYDNRVNGEGFVGSGSWVSGHFVEKLTEYRRESTLDPDSNNNSIRSFTTETVRVYSSNGYLQEIRTFGWGDLPLYFAQNITLVPRNNARNYQISDPASLNPSANNVWFLERTTYTISNGFVVEISSTKTEVLAETLHPRDAYKVPSSVSVTNVGTTSEPWEIYRVETDKSETTITKLGPKYYTKPTRFDWSLNRWEAGEVTVSDDPTEPELRPRVHAGDIYSLETVEMTSTASLSSGKPNPNFVDRKRVVVEYAGSQSHLDSLCNHYATIVKGRRRQWRITVPYSSNLLSIIKLPGRRIAWSPDAHNRALKYLLVGAQIRLSERLSVVDLDLLYLGAV